MLQVSMKLPRDFQRGFFSSSIRFRERFSIGPKRWMLQSTYKREAINGGKKRVSAQSRDSYINEAIARTDVFVSVSKLVHNCRSRFFSVIFQIIKGQEYEPSSRKKGSEKRDKKKKKGSILLDRMTTPSPAHNTRVGWPIRKKRGNDWIWWRAGGRSGARTHIHQRLNTLLENHAGLVKLVLCWCSQNFNNEE